MKITKPDIYYDFDGEAYFADPCPAPSFSQSLGKILIEKSAMHAHAEHPRFAAADEDDDEAEKYDKVKAIGNAAHAKMIGRGKEIVVGEFKNWQLKDARQFRADHEADGKTVILAKHMRTAEAMAQSARAQLNAHEAKDAFTDGRGEVVIAWQENGLWFRCMIDWLSSDLRTIDDFKTTGMSVAPHVLGIRAEDAGWHIQAAMIERGLDILDPKGAGRRRYRFIAQEQARPFALSVMQMDEYWLTMGRKKLDAAIQRWTHAITTMQWPGYPNRVITPEYPGFRETQWLKREENDEFSPPTAPREPMLTDLSGG